jgi:hypothetical protein
LTRSGPSSSSSSSSSSSPQDLVREGMHSFRNLDVNSSMYYFDMAISASRGGSLAPYLWQPGISCSYLNRYSDRNKQFHLNISANPNDVEEIAWDITCLSRMTNDDDDDDSGVGGGLGGRGRKESPFPPEGMMALPSGRSDLRRIMSKVYLLFATKSQPTWHSAAILDRIGRNPPHISL